MIKHASNKWNAAKKVISDGVLFPLLLHRYLLDATFREIPRLILQGVVESNYTTPSEASLR
jgi:hypothetical protein